MGLDIANSIENNLLPLFKVDYDILISTIETALEPNALIAIEGISFNKYNFREVGDLYFNDDFKGRIMTAMNDSTDNAEIYKDVQERKIVSAILGADIAYSTPQSLFEIESNSFMTAIKDTHNGNVKLSNETAMSYVANFFTVVIPERNKKESEQWFVEIEKMEGINRTESGILYKIVTPGDNNVKAAKDEDIVKVLYTGRTKDGNVFDSNRWEDMDAERKEMIKTYQPDQAMKDSPIEFPLNRVIKGWTEGMKLVGQGGRIILWIPSELAYGTQGAGQDIGPNQALCFDVELLEVITQ